MNDPSADPVPDSLSASDARLPNADAPKTCPSDESLVEVGDGPDDSPEETSGWATLGRVLGQGAMAAGRGIAKGAVWTGGAIADGWRAIDPDLKRFVGHAPLLGVTHVFPVDANPSRKDDDGFRPAVFVHGLGGHPGNFSPMRAWFSAGGRKRTWSMSIGKAPRIPIMADEIRRFVDELYEINEWGSGTQIDLVAHSMGGLASRYALFDEDFRQKVSTLVTIGTPHSGTWAARYGYTEKVIDLRPGSPVQKDLETQVPWPGPPSMPRMVAFWSDTDMLLLPPESAAVDGAENIEMHGFTHLSYLLHPSCFQRVWMCLSDDGKLSR